MQFCEICHSIIQGGRCSNRHCGDSAKTIEPKKPEPWRIRQDIVAVTDMRYDRVMKVRG